MLQLEQARNIQTEKSFYYGINMVLLSTSRWSEVYLSAGPHNPLSVCFFFLLSYQDLPVS